MPHIPERPRLQPHDWTVYSDRLVRLPGAARVRRTYGKAYARCEGCGLVVNEHPLPTGPCVPGVTHWYDLQEWPEWTQPLPGQWPTR